MTYERESHWDLTTLDRSGYSATMLELSAVFMRDTTRPHWAYALMEITGITSGAVRSTLDRMTQLGWLTRAEQDLDAPRPHKQRGTPRTYYLTTELGRDEMRKLMLYVRRLTMGVRMMRSSLGPVRLGNIEWNVENAR